MSTTGPSQLRTRIVVWRTTQHFKLRFPGQNVSICPLVMVPIHQMDLLRINLFAKWLLFWWQHTFTHSSEHPAAVLMQFTRWLQQSRKGFSASLHVWNSDLPGELSAICIADSAAWCLHFSICKGEQPSSCETETRVIASAQLLIFFFFFFFEQIRRLQNLLTQISSLRYRVINVIRPPICARASYQSCFLIASENLIRKSV